MAAWQGPALLSYNDAVFSPSDFKNISRIGQDSKLERPAATGRFGLGFNAVYHLTDVPSFCSGDYIVLFDPHARRGALAVMPKPLSPSLQISIAFHTWV
jgi:sacsin